MYAMCVGGRPYPTCQFYAKYHNSDVVLVSHAGTAEEWYHFQMQNNSPLKQQVVTCGLRSVSYFRKTAMNTCSASVCI